MYPTDVREFTTQRLVAQIAQALRNETVLELGPLFDELNLKPTTTGSYHAAAAAVHVLLAHEAGQGVAGDSPSPRHLVAAPNGAGGGAGPKGGAGAPDPRGARRQLKRRSPARRAKPVKSSSTRTSKPRKARVPLKCEVCGRPFLTQGRLTNHLRDQHGGEWAPAQPTATAESAA